MHAMLPLLKSTLFPPIFRRAIDTLQVNLGYRCNQACLHCHVNAGPERKEMMGREIVDQVCAAALVSSWRRSVSRWQKTVFSFKAP